MMDVRKNWNGKGAWVAVEGAAWEIIARIVGLFWQALQSALKATSADPYRKTRTRTTSRGAKGSSYTAYRNPAKAGEVPHKRTGFGAGAVSYELDQPKLTGRVGVLANALYMLFLELGTRKMQPRPWLLKTLDKVRPQLEAIANAGGIKDA